MMKKSLKTSSIFDAGLARAFCRVRFLPTLVLALGFIRAVPPFVWVTVDIIVIINVDCSQYADLPVVIESPIIDIWSKVPYGLM